VKPIVPILLVTLIATVSAVSIYSLTGSINSSNSEIGSSSTSAMPTSFPTNSQGAPEFIGNESADTFQGCTDLVKSVFTQGYSLTIYVSSSSAKKGDYVCVDAILQNVNVTGLTSASPELAVSATIRDTNNNTVFTNSCSPVVPPYSASVPRGVSCAGIWNTGAPYGSENILPSDGTYHLDVTMAFPTGPSDQLSTSQTEVDLTLSG